MVEFGNNNFNSTYKLPPSISKQVIEPQIKKEQTIAKKDTSGDKVNISQNSGQSIPGLQYSDEYLEVVRAVKVLNTSFNVSKEELQDLKQSNPDSYNNYTQNVYGSYKNATAAQREAFYQTFVNSETFSELSSTPSRSATIDDKYKNIFMNDLVSFDEDAAGYIYVAGVGNLPYYDNPGEGMTKEEVEKYADERLKGYLSLSQTPSAKNKLSNILATGKKPTDEEKQEVYEMLKADIASRIHKMSASEVYAISSVLGAGFGSVSLIPELEKHKEAELALSAAQENVENFEIENPQSTLQEQYKKARAALNIAFDSNDPTLHFALPSGSEEVDTALTMFRNTLSQDIPRIKEGEELRFQPNIKESQIIGQRLEELEKQYKFEVV